MNARRTWLGIYSPDDRIKSETPHRSLQQRPPDPPTIPTIQAHSRLQRRQILGGLLNGYRHEQAA